MEYKIMNRKNEVTATILIDKCDFELVNKYKWTITRRGYMQSKKAQSEMGHLQLHRLITNAPSGMVVNHINGNTFDNRQGNLEIVTQKENTRKRKGQQGIYWDSKRKKWNAKIGVNYKNVNLGYFEKIEDALKARKEAEAREWSGV